MEWISEIEKIDFCPSTRQKASMLLTLMQKPTFLVSLVVIDKFMGILIKPTAGLQSKDEFDILQAYDLMDAVIKVGELNIKS